MGTARNAHGATLATSALLALIALPALAEPSGYRSELESGVPERQLAAIEDIIDLPDEDRAEFLPDLLAFVRVPTTPEDLGSWRFLDEVEWSQDPDAHCPPTFAERAEDLVLSRGSDLSPAVQVALTRLLARDQPSRQRAAAAWFAWSGGASDDAWSADLGRALVDASRHGRPEMRAAALSALSQPWPIDPTDVARSILEGLASNDPVVRIGALEGMRWAHGDAPPNVRLDARDLRLALRLLADDDAEFFAQQVLVGAGDRALPALERAILESPLVEGTPDHRRDNWLAATLARVATTSPAAEALARRLLVEAPPHVRPQLLLSLSFHAEALAAPLVRSALRDPDVAVRAAAAQALALSDPQPAAALEAGLELVRDPTEWRRVDGCFAIDHALSWPEPSRLAEEQARAGCAALASLLEEPSPTLRELIRYSVVEADCELSPAQARALAAPPPRGLARRGALRDWESEAVELLIRERAAGDSDPLTAGMVAARQRDYIRAALERELRSTGAANRRAALLVADCCMPRGSDEPGKITAGILDTLSDIAIADPLPGLRSVACAALIDTGSTVHLRRVAERAPPELRLRAAVAMSHRDRDAAFATLIDLVAHGPRVHRSRAMLELRRVASEGPTERVRLAVPEGWPDRDRLQRILDDALRCE